MDKVKIMIAIPTLDYIHYRFVESLTNMEKRMEENGIEYDVVFKGGTLVYMSRNLLVQDAIFRDYTHVLWLDADMVFEPDLYEKLLATEKEFVTGLYRARHGQMRPLVLDDLYSNHRIDPWPKEIFEIVGCGMGCCLTTTTLLRNVFMEYGDPFTPTPRLGEDYAFCERVDKYGYTMYCEPNAECAHIIQEELWPDMSKKSI